MSPAARNVPILMFHGAAPDRPDRPPQADLWLDPGTLEAYLQHLRRARFETLFLKQVRAIRLGADPVPPRAVVLTFDDGYLDFWLYVYPLLREYGVRATCFVTTEFVADEPPRRLPDAFPYGFLAWSEMREMEASGLVDIQSHAVTHTWYPVGPRLLDVHRPGVSWKVIRSLWWNRFPERKPYWYSLARHEDLPWGVPVLENEKSLLARRYSPHPVIEDALVKVVAEEGGAAFFDRPDWRERYGRTYERVRADLGEKAGSWETEQQRRGRITGELRDSRRILGAALNKEVRYFCAPGGSLNAEVLALAAEVGYQGVSVPRWFEPGRNAPGGDPNRFYRVPATSIFKRVRSPRLDALSFRWRVGAEAGSLTGRMGWAALRGLRSARLI